MLVSDDFFRKHINMITIIVLDITISKLIQYDNHNCPRYHYFKL